MENGVREVEDPIGPRLSCSTRCFPLCKHKRHGYNQHHLVCRASSYSSCSHTRLLIYSHRQPYITAPNQKQLSHPNLHRHHIQGDVLHSIAKAIRQSPSPIYFFKVKFHAGIIGKNEHADALAKKSATTYSDIADTSIRTAGPEGNPFYNTTTSTGLQKKT